MPEMRKLLARFVESTDESLRKRTAQADPPGGITTPEYAREMTGSTSLCRNLGHPPIRQSHHTIEIWKQNI